MSDEFEPEEDNSASEFNPYADFLENSNTEDENKAVPQNAGTFVSEEDVTTENDIELPPFMDSGSPASKADSDAASENNADEFSPSDFQGTEKHSESISAPSFGKQGETQTDFSKDGESDASVSFSQPEAKEESHGGNTSDKDEDIKFESKISAKAADSGGPKAKPKVLNKKILLTVIVISFGLVMVVSFLAPTKKSKSSKNEKPVAERHMTTDYASLATSRPDEVDGMVDNHYKDVSALPDEIKSSGEVEIPPVIPPKEEKPVYTQQNINYNTGNGGGSGTTLSIPDTRNDSLQGKHISGIKGLTSTQQSYSTDYQQTIAKNTASAGNTGGYTLPSKEEYMNNVLSAYSSAYGNATSQNNSYAVQNDQAGKNSFFNDGRQGANVGQGEWLNLNTLWQGTIFEAVLTSELNTDLPGEITARIAKNIYSSQDGRYLLIPQNSVLYGTYNSSISYSQSRVQVAWHTLIRPDGYQIQLGNMNATDAKGASGLKGFVNDHPMAYLKAIGLMSVFSIVNTEFSKQMGDTQNEYIQNLLANSQEVTMELGDKLIDRAMNVQPTIKIKSGTKINIVVNQNLSLPPCEDIPVTQPYHRQR